MDEKRTDDHEKKSKGGEAWWQPALAMFARLSAWVAVPVIAATFIGNWLDEKYDSAPWGLIAIVGAAFVISMIGLVIEAAKEYKKINSSKKEDDKNDKIPTS